MVRCSLMQERNLQKALHYFINYNINGCIGCENSVSTCDFFLKVAACIQGCFQFMCYNTSRLHY